MCDQVPNPGLLLKVAGCNNSETARKVVASLYRKGLLDARFIERCEVKERVAILCKYGMKRCVAMEKVANERQCSYAKIRQIIYQKN